MDDFEGCKTSVEVSADRIEIAGELEVEPEDGTELLQSQERTLMAEELLLAEVQREYFFEMESTSGQDAVKIIEMTATDLKYYINLVDKTVAGFERISSNFERSSTVDKMPSNSITCYSKICEKDRSTDATIFTVVLF